MSAAVLLGHGSPDPAGRAELLELRALVRAWLGVDVHLGVLEFAGGELPSVDETFLALRGRGPMAAQPLVLFEGLHGRRDLPEAAARARARLGLDVRLGVPLGGDPRLVELTAARVAARRPVAGDLLLFVGRGSSEPEARRQTERVAESVAGRWWLDHVVCYAGISRPDLREGFGTALDRRPGRILALPYLLHTGVLARRVHDVLTAAAARDRVPLELLPHIGNAPGLVELVASRIEGLR